MERGPMLETNARNTRSNLVDSEQHMERDPMSETMTNSRSNLIESEQHMERDHMMEISKAKEAVVPKTNSQLFGSLWGLDSLPPNHVSRYVYSTSLFPFFVHVWLNMGAFIYI